MRYSSETLSAAARRIDILFARRPEKAGRAEEVRDVEKGLRSESHSFLFNPSSEARSFRSKGQRGYVMSSKLCKKL
jgi:hypothetical protein